MTSNYNFAEQHAAAMGCDITWADDPLFGGRDGDPYFGLELTEDGSPFDTLSSEQFVEPRRAAA